MKRNLLIFSLFAFSCNTGNNEMSNVKITNSSFEKIVNQFVEHYTKKDDSKIRVASVSIWINEKDTIVGLYANKKLKEKFYIGCIKSNNSIVYFYSNVNNSLKGLFNITSKPKVKVDSIWDYNETYSVFYVFKNDSLKLEHP
jgi:hypothetical protein